MTKSITLPVDRIIYHLSRVFSFVNLKFTLLYLLIASIPFEIWPIFAVAGRGIKPSWFIGLLFVAVCFVELCMGRQRIRNSMTGLSVLIFAIIGSFSLINLFNTSYGRLIDFGTLWFQLALFTVLFFAITSIDWTERRIKQALTVWVGVAFLISLYAIYQMIARNLELPLAYLPILNPSMGGGDFTRHRVIGPYLSPSSVFAEPSFLGFYLMAPLLLTGAPLLLPKRYRRYLIYPPVAHWGAFLLMAAAFVLTFSIGAYAALGGGILIALLNPRIRACLIRMLGLTVLVCILASFLLKPVLDVNLAQAIFVRTKANIVNLANPTERPQLGSPYAKSSVKPRAERALAALNVWIRHPILGVGLNNFAYYYPPDVSPLVHGSFILVLADTGLLGFLGLVLIFVIPIVTLRRKQRNADLFSFDGMMTLAFYYVLWARGIGLLISLTWAKETFWLELGMAGVVILWAKSSPRNDA